MSDAETDRQLSPLFREPNADGKYIYADEIAEITLYRMIQRNGRQAQRIKVPRLDYRDENGGEFVFNPFETTEDDVLEFFGGGEYFIEAWGHNGKKLKCGHLMPLDGPPKPRRWRIPGAPADPVWMRRGGAAPGFGYDPWGGGEEGGEEDEEEEDMSFAKHMLKAQEEQAKEMRRLQEERAKEARLEARERESTTAAIMGKVLDSATARGTSNEGAVDVLKRQLEEQNTRHREELRRRDDEIADLRKEHREEITGKNREMEEQRRTFTRELEEQRRKQEREIDDLRGEIKDLKRKHDAELDDVKRRSAKDADGEIDRLKKRLSDSENDLARERRQWEKDRRDLEKEIYELQRDLADVPQEGANGGTPKLPANTPWWGAVGAEVLKWAGNRRAQEAQQEAMRQQSQQQQQRQAPPQQMPPQQQPQYAAPPPPPPPQAPPANFRETPMPPPQPAGPPPAAAPPSNGAGAPHPFSFDGVEPFVEGDDEFDDDELEDDTEDDEETGEPTDDANEA